MAVWRHDVSSGWPILGGLIGGIIGIWAGAKLAKKTTMNYIVAVSGGVDSVVLLDMLSKTLPLIVAHVDHGIPGRKVRRMRGLWRRARRYQLPFVSTELHLGAHASEETAREKRYEFLFGEANIMRSS